MDTAWDKGKGEHSKERRAPLITKPGNSTKIRIMIEKKAAECGKASGDKKPDRKIGFGTGIIFSSNFHGNEFGYGGLDPCSGKCKTDGGYRSDKLINAETFCTNGTR